MMALYWAIIFVVFAILAVISVRVFRMTFGLPPVLRKEIQDLENEKRLLEIMVVLAILLYIVASLIALIGGV